MDVTFIFDLLSVALLFTAKHTPIHFLYYT